VRAIRCLLGLGRLDHASSVRQAKQRPHDERSFNVVNCRRRQQSTLRIVNVDQMLNHVLVMYAVVFW
jgi:hypothetical protein